MCQEHLEKSIKGDKNTEIFSKGGALGAKRNKGCDLGADTCLNSWFVDLYNSFENDFADSLKNSPHNSERYIKIRKGIVNSYINKYSATLQKSVGKVKGHNQCK
ncbi:hypothetical protein AYI68_g4686 [Smittium mucronatum]|uniref:Uncharacterized protein n=1 Tax=Smittium mucronatum TaxID=133383 RepID=A0A1R0GWF2_9FUNG|nr:hypothetical protein AYI68_g4686 [Smittium mucronatum]